MNAQQYIELYGKKTESGKYLVKKDDIMKVLSDMVDEFVSEVRHKKITNKSSARSLMYSYSKKCNDFNKLLFENKNPFMLKEGSFKEYLVAVCGDTLKVIIGEEPLL